MTKEITVNTPESSLGTQIERLYKEFFPMAVGEEHVIAFVGQKNEDDILAMKRQYKAKGLELQAVQVVREHTLKTLDSEYPTLKINYKNEPLVTEHFLRSQKVTDIILRNPPQPSRLLPIVSMLSDYLKEVNGNLLITFMEGDHWPPLETKLMELGAQFYKIPPQDFLPEELIYVLSPQKNIIEGETK